MLSLMILLIALLLLAISFYQIRILKRINEKLIKLVAPERDVRRIAKAQSEAAWENYRQGEFYWQLLRLLDLSAPIPSTRSWAASPDVLLTLLDLAKSSKLLSQRGSFVARNQGLFRESGRSRYYFATCGGSLDLRLGRSLPS